MAETVQSSFIKVTAGHVVTGDDGKQQVISYEKTYTFTDGTGTDQIGSWFYDATRPLNATNEDIDVKGSASFTDFQGVAMALTGIRVILLENLDTDTGDYFELTQPAANGVPNILKAASDGIRIGPGGLLLWISPVDAATVTAGTGDLLNVASADNSNYKLFIAGPNA